MPRYTDRDVQNLISDIRHLINQPEVRHIAPLSCSRMDRRLLSFEPDPWEELHQYRLSQHVIGVDTTMQLIDKAVELGLVTKVGAE